MRPPRFHSIVLVASALIIAGAAIPLSARGQAPTAPSPDQQQGVPPGPYKPVPVTLAAAMNDPSFDAFRQELANIAQRKDRAALAQLIATNFFWVPEDTDTADKSKPPIDNLAKAINLDGSDASGWETLAAYAAEPSAMPDPQRNGVFCAPAEPNFDDQAADELANSTQTDASDWVFPVRDGVEVRADAKQDAPVTDKLGMYLVRVLPDDSPANAINAQFVKVMTPAGKTGYVAIDTVLPIGGEQLCYTKQDGSWKIAGFLGGEPN